MDPYAQVQGEDIRSPEHPHFSCNSTRSTILLIGRDPTLQASRAAVLTLAGFHVHAVSPAQAKGLIDGDRVYPLVVFSHTIDMADIFEIGTRIRLRDGGSKLLFILGPDAVQMDFSMFDATLEGLDGPAALVREVRRLVPSPA